MSAAVIIAIGATAQSYKISGTVPEGTTQVYVTNYEAKTTDTLNVKDGRFEGSGEANGKLFGGVTAQGIDTRVHVFLEGDIVVDFKEQTASGNAENEGLTTVNKQMNVLNAPIVERSRILTEKYQSGQQITEEEQAEFSKLYEVQHEKIMAYCKSVLETNTTMRYPALLLRQNFTNLDNEYLFALLDRNPAYLQTSFAKEVVKSIEGLKRRAVGIRFTDASAPDTAGVERKLSEFAGHGNYVLVDFWASWCGPCMQELPNVKAAYEKYHPKGFEIVGVSLDSKADAWKGAIKRKGMSWPQISDLGGWQSGIAGLYGVSAIPETMLITPDGTIIATGLAGKALQDKLQEIYGE